MNRLDEVIAERDFLREELGKMLVSMKEINRRTAENNKKEAEQWAIIDATASEMKELRDRKQQNINVIAKELQYWLDFTDDRDGDVTDDTKIMSPPAWPTRGTLKNWIQVLGGQ